MTMRTMTMVTMTKMMVLKNLPDEEEGEPIGRSVKVHCCLSFKLQMIIMKLIAIITILLIITIIISIQI